MRNNLLIKSSPFVIILLLLSISGCPTKKGRVNPAPVSNTQFTKLTITGDNHKSGIFDISVEYDQGGIGWMAYSRVEFPKYVETHIARSNDHGKTWKYIATVNKSTDGTFAYSGKKLKVAWRSETPTLLYDPGDTTSRRWKLFSHRYPAKSPFKKGSHLYAEGWIEYRTAANPKGPWSKPIRLFGKRENNCLIDLSAIHPNLKNILWYNELGSIAVNGVIYLSLDASTTPSGLGEWRKRKIILVSSRDHGKSWRYAGTLTDYNDANNFGYFIFTGSSLVKEGKRLFLFISPSGAKGLFKKNRSHDGTVIVEIEDISRAKLKRDAKGKLVIHKWIKPSLQSGGLSDYDEKNTYGGILFSQINTGIRSRNADFFQVYSTGQRITKP